MTDDTFTPAQPTPEPALVNELADVAEAHFLPEITALRSALEDCLGQMGWTNYTDDEMREEMHLGNGKAAIILRARAALAAQPPAAPVETMAEEILRADVEPPEASFDNAKDMLAYLDADLPTAQDVRGILPRSSAGRGSEPPEDRMAGRDCPGVMESDPALFNILNNALGTMHYHRLMSALNWNGYVITREPQEVRK